MASKVNLTVLDYGSEKSTVGFYVEDIVELNFDEIVGAGGTIQTFQTALDGITIGTIARRVVNAEDTAISSTPPANAFAQRESKWLVQYSDDVSGKLYSMEVPCADLSLLVANTENMNVGAGAGATFVSAFESAVRSVDGETVTVIGVKYVSRDL
jgi:hypothetical protein